MSDIVERLRDTADMRHMDRGHDAVDDIMREAADTINHLTRELSEARAAGRAEGMEEAALIIDHLNGWGSDCGRGGHAEHFAAAIRAAKEK